MWLIVVRCGEQRLLHRLGNCESKVLMTLSDRAEGEFIKVQDRLEREVKRGDS